MTQADVVSPDPAWRLSVGRRCSLSLPGGNCDPIILLSCAGARPRTRKGERCRPQCNGGIATGRRSGGFRAGLQFKLLPGRAVALGVGYRHHDRRPSCRFKFAVSESRFPSRDVRFAVSDSRPGPSRLRGLVLRIVGLRRRSPASPWPARLRGSVECSAAGRAVEGPPFPDRIPPGRNLSAPPPIGPPRRSPPPFPVRGRRGFLPARGGDGKGGQPTASG